MSRSTALLTGCLLVLAATAARPAPEPPPRGHPNVVLIMTDDQGYGDLGTHGNPIVRTPNLDRMAARSARLGHFYVSPVCTPTRASLMTGRYNYRTRAIDTYRGRAMMDPDEVTLPEVLRREGYTTGIFGKWHLGDTYPLRAMDQGFEEALVHRGGGIGQPSDPPGGEGKYTDPVLFRNGRQEAAKGYCTDVYFREGIRWADSAARRGKPFFLYLPTNAPHGPFDDVPPDLLQYYRSRKISPDQFPANVRPNLDADTLARVYAMIENVDANVGRLFAWLDERDLAANTLVVFMTDNGAATVGYNAGLRGRKSQVYDGGIRSPFFACWPGRLKPGIASERVTAHIDVMPTLLEACGAKPPRGVRADGRSFWPLLTGKTTDWPDRTLFFQTHRGDRPVLYHHFAARGERWKLVHNSGFGRESLPEGPLRLELFDMQRDPYEQQDLAAAHPEVVADLKQRYEAWFRDVSSTRRDNYDPPRIQLGTSREDPVVLTRQDWRGADWAADDRGHWEVQVTRSGRYDVRLLFRPLGSAGAAEFSLGAVKLGREVAAGGDSATFEDIRLTSGPARLQAAVTERGQARGVRFVEVSRRP